MGSSGEDYHPIEEEEQSFKLALGQP